MGQKGAEKLGRDAFQGSVSMLPSEYVDRNCFTGLANVKRRELGMRYEIGIDNMLWGTDFPHPEGTWPNTHEWLCKTFFDIPIDETRRMLGLTRGRDLRLRPRRARAARGEDRPDADRSRSTRRGPHGGRSRGPLGTGERSRAPLAHRPRLRPVSGVNGRASAGADKVVASAPLTANDVIDAAARIVEQDGLDALTMRRLSDDLGVAVTSIYWHVGNRRALLDALVDRVLADMGMLQAIGRTPA